MHLSEFISLYDSIEPDERGCRTWPGPFSSNGYARAYVVELPREQRANRIALYIKLGRKPENNALHTCDNPLCITYEHLYDGTHAQNMLDAVTRDRLAKGNKNGQRLHPERTPRGNAHYSRTNPEKLARGLKHGSHTKPENLARGDRHGSRTKPEKLKRGADNGNAKLTDEQVIEIRRIYALGQIGQKRLAKMFGVTQCPIRNIVNNRSRQHLL